jgi:hypothetical protein
MNYNTDITKFQMERTKLSQLSRTVDYIGTTTAIDSLIDERGEGFYNYVNWLGLAKDPNLVVLSSQHHYFYDPAEMINVKTVINLKELNRIHGIKSHLHSYLHHLPQKSNFIGCFVDNDKINGYVLRDNSPLDSKNNFEDVENSIVSRNPFINMLYSIMDLKTNTYLSVKKVSSLLEGFGFRVMDMTAHNGLTFFYSQKARDIYN